MKKPYLTILKKVLDLSLFTFHRVVVWLLISKLDQRSSCSSDSETQLMKAIKILKIAK